MKFPGLACLYVLVNLFPYMEASAQSKEIRLLYGRLEALTETVVSLQTTFRNQNKKIASLQGQVQHFSDNCAKKSIVKQQEKRIKDLKEIVKRIEECLQENPCAISAFDQSLNYTNHSNEKPFSSSAKRHIKNFLNNRSFKPEWMDANPTRVNAVKDSKLDRQGRLLLPTKPQTNPDGIIAFYAYMSAFEKNLNSNRVIKFDTEVTDVGDAYHPGSGVFIAPRDGVYVFNWHIRIWGSTGISTEIVVNNIALGSMYFRTDSANDDEGMSKTVVVHVSKNDDVFIRTHSTYAEYGEIGSTGLGKPSFAGWLLA